MSDHGNAQGVRNHREADEALCVACSSYLRRLRGEAFAAPTTLDDTISITVRVPRSTYWTFADAADDNGQAVDERLLEMILLATTVPQSQATLTLGQEKEIRQRWLEGESSAAIARSVGVHVSTVRGRINKWGGTSNGRAKKKPPTQKESQNGR